MLASNIPANFQLPFGNSASGAYIRAIPVASQIGITAGAASLTDGFPPVCFADPLAGGVPPSGADFNGILNEITANIRWWGAGGYPKRDATFSAAIGGYPNGAILQSADNTGYWISTADNNTSDPDANGANWLPAWFRGMATVAITSADVTLTLTQYARPLINLTGVLTGNRSLILPPIVGEWTVINGTTGAYTVTVKPAAGTGVPALQGALTRVVGNGTNVYAENAVTATTAVNQSGGSVNATTITASSSILSSSPSAGIGYAAGAGGVVTQVTSKVNDVTLNTLTGRITTSNAALAAGGSAIFNLFNSSISVGDVVIGNVISGYTLGGSYSVRMEFTRAGGTVVVLKNETGSNLSDTVVIQYAVIKGSTN